MEWIWMVIKMGLFGHYPRFLLTLFLGLYLGLPVMEYLVAWRAGSEVEDG